MELIRNTNPKILIEVQKQSLKVNYSGFPSYIIVRAALIDAINALEENMKRNSTIQEKSEIIIPSDLAEVPVEVMK